MDRNGNVYSQFGEDRLIEELITRFRAENLLDKWACEFGPWDGIHLSNTANLIINHGYTAVLIEADLVKFKQLQKNMRPYSSILINRFVALDGVDTLDNILETTNIPSDFDLLSIDIDGADYWVFEGLIKYRPKIVVIEINPTVPKEISFVNPRDTTITQGSGIKSIAELAHSKGYLVCGITTCNLILIDSKFGSLFPDKIVSLQNLPDPLHVTRLWQTSDGKIHTEPNLQLLWHDLVLTPNTIQKIPKIFQFFPDNMGG